MSCYTLAQVAEYAGSHEAVHAGGADCHVPGCCNCGDDYCYLPPVLCGRCGEHHAGAAGVRHCYAEAQAKAEEEAFFASPEGQAQCEHGLSAWLCAGPGHYPDDRYDY
jgi:hypothetical protein